MRASLKIRQAGATAIEFAIVLLLFFAFLLGIIEASRMLYTWNAATQAARVGARYAVVCDDGSGTYTGEVLQRMKAWAPQITNIAIDWKPADCDLDTCTSVTVSITGLKHFWLAPVPNSFDRLIPMPSFTTSLRREIMRQDRNSDTGAKICS